MTWQFTLTGLLIGALVGLTGMGGGPLMTPILILFFGFKPTLAVGTDILHGAVFKSFGAVRHRGLGTVHARIAFWMFVGSAPMSLLGVEVATWIENQYGSGVGDAMAKVIGAALILGGSDSSRRPSSSEEYSHPTRRSCSRTAIACPALRDPRFPDPRGRSCRSGTDAGPRDPGARRGRGLG